MADAKITAPAAGEDDALFEKRESIRLTPENVVFTRSEGNLISLDVTGPSGEKEHFERVVVLRSFPITDPDEYIVIREPETRHSKRGSEIGLIHHIRDFDDQTVALLNEELERRYFTPEISRIYSFKEKFGYTYWDAETSAGRVSFVLNNPSNNIRILEDGRIFVFDIDGNCFQISDPNKLDRNSYRKIEIYL
ncbi:MAG: DUF1854 domain-containing protein [Clostridia bacterium]|nr:DUF1854 domain-containing protein [Clostridia bacterium]